MTAPFVSFVIPVKNDARRLERCLRSISAAAEPPASVEIIVADNGSSDDTAAVARARGAMVLELPGARLGELRNRAAGFARGRILAFVDADHEIGPDWVQIASATLADDRVAAVGAAYVPPSPSTRVQRLYDRLRRHPIGPAPADWLGSGNLAVKRAVFHMVGGFDTSLETCEDVDLCRRLRAGGWTLIDDGRLRSIHHGDPQTLRNVFLGELWRGRDNVRVSLRPPLSLRTLVSAAIPVFMLLALVSLAAGLLSLAPAGLTVAGLAAAAAVGVVMLRTSRMVRAGAAVRDLLPAFAVAAAYELGRAFALAAPFGYARRRRGAVR